MDDGKTDFKDYLCLVTEPILEMKEENHPMYEHIMHEIEVVTGLKRDQLEFKRWQMDGRTTAVYKKETADVS